MPDVPAAAQTLQILRLLSEQAGPVPAATIVRELNLPRSTVYHLLATMAEHGFVTHLPDDRRFALGIAAYELGTGYTRQAPLQRLARVPLAGLTDRVRQTSHLAVQHGREVVYVIEERAPGRPPLVTDVGVRLPAHLTASGRAILAALPAAAVRALFPDPSAFVLRTEVGPRSISALRSALVQVRRRGFAVEDGEVSPGYASIATAVLDHSGHPVAAVAVTFPAAGTSATERDLIAVRVARTAAVLSRRVGGTPVGAVAAQSERTRSS
ncbi:MAG TPA: IclR family transcriptional regulator [Jatrophihabitans sp.]|nr:IclR family transcriptional regulator [Jatrophihabitans sp.]